MKFGVHSYMIVDDIDSRASDELAATAAAWGAQGVEVHMDRSEDLPQAELKKAAARHGVEWTRGVVPTAGHNLVSPDPTVRKAGVQHITIAIQAASDLGANNIGGVLSAAGRVFTGQAVTEAELERVVDGLPEVAPVAEANNVTVSVEATSRYLGYVLNTAAQARAFLVRLGSTHVQVQLDAGPRLGYVQIAESHRGLLGSGHIPWPQVMDALRAVDYDGWLTFEAFTPEHASIAERSNTWRRLWTEKDLVTEGIDYLRGLT